MHACLLESKQLWAGQASTASLLLGMHGVFGSLASVRWCGSGVVVTPEQVCRELKPGRQDALPCLCCAEVKVVLEQTEPERLSITNITKNQGRGGVIWSCPSLLLNLCSVHQSTCTPLPCRSAAAVKSLISSCLTGKDRPL